MRGAGLGPLVLGTLAVGAGALFLADVGALAGMASRNVAAYLAGLLLGWAAHRLARRPGPAALLFGLGTAILAATLLVGTELDGVRRWLPLGPVHLQPALILAPLLLAIVAGREGRHWRLALLLPLALVAAQPDAATATAMAGATLALITDVSLRSKSGWTRRRRALAGGAVALAALTLLVAGVKTPPAVAFVEGTADLALTSGSIAAALHIVAVLLGIGAMLAAPGPSGLALAAYFALSVLAALFFAFPMPIVGAGPSHLLGFGLAIGWLTVKSRSPRRR